MARMNIDDIDDFYEPSEFDMMVEDFKEELRKSVKKEYQDELEAARKEIAELKEFRDKKAEYERDLAAATMAIDISKQRARKDALNERISDILSELNEPAWKADYHTEYIHEKCDKCDENRRIHFKSPSGRDMTEECECSKQKFIYEPIQCKCVRFYTKNKEIVEADYVSWVETRKEIVGGYYEQSGTWGKLDDDNYAFIKYKDQRFDRLNSNYTYFLDKNKCQEYCDWLNSELPHTL